MRWIESNNSRVTLEIGRLSGPNGSLIDFKPDTVSVGRLGNRLIEFDNGNSQKSLRKASTLTIS